MNLRAQSCAFTPQVPHGLERPSGSMSGESVGIQGTAQADTGLVLSTHSYGLSSFTSLFLRIPAHSLILVYLSIYPPAPFIHHPCSQLPLSILPPPSTYTKVSILELRCRQGSWDYKKGRYPGKACTSIFSTKLLNSVSKAGPSAQGPEFSLADIGNCHFAFCPCLLHASPPRVVALV